MEKGEKLKNFIKTTIRELLMEDKDVDVFGHKLSVLLHMIDDQVDKPKQVIKNKINQYSKTMPRTMLRYAIEHFSNIERKKFLDKKNLSVV
jgi:hypothetical protein